MTFVQCPRCGRRWDEGDYNSSSMIRQLANDHMTVCRFAIVDRNPEGGDAQQAPAESPQSGGEAVTPEHSIGEVTHTPIGDKR
jgi:hypothetical protein